MIFNGIETSWICIFCHEHIVVRVAVWKKWFRRPKFCPFCASPMSTSVDAMTDAGYEKFSENSD